MIAEIPCTPYVNPEKIIAESDMTAITEFRRELANRGMPVERKLVCDFDSKPGYIIVMTYPPPIWHEWFNVFSFHEELSDDKRFDVNLRKFDKAHGTPKVRMLEMDDETANEFNSEGLL